jgi:hypothetical protein
VRLVIGERGRCPIKWFKHISDSLDDPFIVELLDEFGADAYLVFFGVIEIYSREFLPENQWKLDVTLPFFHRKLHVSPSKIKKILSKIWKWEVEYKNNRVIIFIPKFKQLLDNWTIRQIPKNLEQLRSCDVETTQPIRIKNKELEKETNINIVAVKKSRVFLKPTLEEITEYCKERNNKIDPQYFLNYQTARDWVLKGGQKIKDWKAVIRTWESNDFNKKPQQDFNGGKCYAENKE